MFFADGLNCSNFDRAVFQELVDGGLGCVTVCLGFWEDAVASMDALGRFRDLVRANKDLVAIARTGAEIEAIAGSGRCALVIGYQNTAVLNGNIRFPELFADMGLRVLQLTYNNQNEFGGSCYEPQDSGISRFGREMIPELNRCGILIDLSHVGERTSLDVVELSEHPVAITHANPATLVPHLRNKSDTLIRALAARRGVIGLATYANICGEYGASPSKWADMVAWTVDLAGIGHVAIGTDHGRNVGMPDLTWMRQGNWSRIINYGAGNAARPGKVAEPGWIDTMKSFGAIATALAARGFSQDETALLMGGNWLRLYTEVFGETDAQKQLAA
ncbi:dipeptidase [Pseudogemmobacter humi]|uniref:Membrane dipeptidase (Peptidase family M19) n=1 Tax=Pseudogemmobacter humi TaxID=2483812 RepID=A0A3P5XFS9_9RHOB|nr:membrane dipeptidase [Pseudogemmobacter humi]VDC33598.1 Membrane dipeptidase (Peptidase family M19) [Pseudogemmobacter humi]